MPPLRRILMVNTILSGAWDTHLFVVPIFGVAIGLSATTIGVILAAFAAATFVIRLVLPFIQTRVRSWTLVRAAMATAAIDFLLYPFFTDVGMLIGLSFVLGLALGCCQPSMLSLLHQYSPPGRAAEAVGLRMALINASQVSLPLTFGALGAVIGVAPLFWAYALALVAGGWANRNPRKNPIPPSLREYAVPSVPARSARRRRAALSPLDCRGAARLARHRAARMARRRRRLGIRLWIADLAARLRFRRAQAGHPARSSPGAVPVVAREPRHAGMPRAGVRAGPRRLVPRRGLPPGRPAGARLLPALWDREMSTGAYLPRWLRCATEHGPVNALVFIMNRANPAYIRALPEPELLAIVRRASGRYGPCTEYVVQTAQALRQAGIRDARLEQIARQLEADVHPLGV